MLGGQVGIGAERGVAVSGAVPNGCDRMVEVAPLLAGLPPQLDPQLELLAAGV